MKNLHLISCVPDSPNFVWETANNLFNQRKFGLSDKARVLIFLTHTHLKDGFNGKWKFLERKFPEVKFFYYPDVNNLEKRIIAFNYIPLLRPYMLQKHWEQFPELVSDCIYYHDSDTVFTKYPDFLNLKDDNVCYLSDTKSYLNSDYFLSKEKDVLPDKKEDYQKVDVLQKVADILGIDKQIFIDNKDNTGGAQYLLKNIDSDFWKDVLNCSIQIRNYLMDINKRFFASEEAGFQSWCADMWAALGNLWKRNFEVTTPKEMDFSWSSEYIEEWDKKTIYHDASSSPDPISKDGKIFRTFFKKGNKLVDGGYDYILHYEDPRLKMPFQDDLSYVSPEICSYKYVESLNETKKFIYG